MVVTLAGPGSSSAAQRWDGVLIFLIFFCGVGVYAWEINRVAGRPVSVHYIGRVLDKLTSAPLPESKVTVTLEIQASFPEGLPDNVVRTVTENGRTLKFSSQGFDRETT